VLHVAGLVAERRTLADVRLVIDPEVLVSSELWWLPPVFGVPANGLPRASHLVGHRNALAESAEGGTSSFGIASQVQHLAPS
jgi:hypothetical protein